MGNGSNLITLDLSMLLQIINFLILVYVFWRLFGKKIGPILDERKKIVTSKLLEAEEERANARKATADASELKKEAKKRANEILIRAEISADERKERIIKEANQSREKMLTTAEIDIEKMKQNASKELQKEVSGLAVTLAEKILKENIDKDGDKIINNFIEEVGE